MNRWDYQRHFFTKQGISVYDPTRHVLFIPPKIQPPSGVYKRWKRLKRKSLRLQVFRNRLIVWGASALLFLGCMVGFAYLSFIFNYKVIALAGGYFTFNLSLYIWYLLDDHFPQHWYEIKSNG